jgi:predicted DNA binding CopG/RHH family protein
MENLKRLTKQIELVKHRQMIGVRLEKGLLFIVKNQAKENGYSLNKFLNIVLKDVFSDKINMGKNNKKA